MELTKLVGKEKKREYSHEKSDAALYDKMKTELYDKLFASVSKQIANKSERSSLIKEIKDAFVASLPENHGFEASLIGPYFHKIHKKPPETLLLRPRKDLTEEIWTKSDRFGP